MTLMAAILFFLTLFVIILGLFVYVSPILLGLFIIIIGNVIVNKNEGKLAPVLWNVLAIVTTICSTAMLWKDLYDEAVNYKAMPFVILIVFGIFSLLIYAAIQVAKN